MESAHSPARVCAEVPPLTVSRPALPQLHVLVTEGENLVLPLRARGVGTTMHCAEDLSVIDFGHVFTNNVCERSFLLENKGRRVQTLQWINTTAKEREAKIRREAREKTPSKKKKSRTAAEEPAAVFTVEVRICRPLLLPRVRFRSLTLPALPVPA